MHENTLNDVEEDGIFFEERFFYHFFIIMRFPYQSLLSYLEDFDKLPARQREKILGIHRRVIQKIIYLRGTDRLFLSKEPKSTAKLKFLAELYPEARFVFTTRHSADFLSSLELLLQRSTQCKTGLDTTDMPWWRPSIIEDQRRDCERLLQMYRKLPDNRKITISFNQLTRQPMPTLKRIYDRLNLKIPTTIKQHIWALEDAQETRDRGYDYKVTSHAGFEAYDRFVAEIDTLPTEDITTQ